MRHKDNVPIPIEDCRPIPPWRAGADRYIREGRGLGTALLANAAEFHDGARVTWVNSGLAVAELHGNQYLIYGTLGNESALGAKVVNNKSLTKTILESSGVRTPRGGLAFSEEQAVELARSLRCAVVVKPRGGGLGKGVTVNVIGDEEVRAAYKKAQRGQAPVLVEEYIDIDAEFRCMATPKECVAVVGRFLPEVVGDGASTIRQLIDAKNLDRAKNLALRTMPIPIDQVMESTLANKGLNLSDVIADGRRVVVRNVGGLSGGGEAHELSQSVDPHVKALAVKAVRAVPGLEWAGVDIVTERGSLEPYILELNCQAGYGAASYPLKGEPVDVACALWKSRRGGDTRTSPTRHSSPARRIEPITLSDELHLSEQSDNLTTLGTLFFDYVGKRGYKTDEISPAITRVSNDSGFARWFTRDAITDYDLLSVILLLRKHRYVKQLLRLHGARIPRSKTLRRPEFVEKHFGSSPIQAIPRSKSWAYKGALSIKGEEADKLDWSLGSWVIQDRPPGTRVRVLSSRQRSFVTIQPEGTEPTADVSVIDACADGATRAVRAIPELRWASVDLCVDEGGQDDPIVEGMALAPSVSRKDVVIDGSLECFFDELLGDSTRRDTPS